MSKKSPDIKQNEILEKFINDSPVATNIKVSVSSYYKSFKPRNPFDNKAYYEDCNMLSSILMGAENFCYWLRRNGYEIKRKKK